MLLRYFLNLQTYFDRLQLEISKQMNASKSPKALKKSTVEEMPGEDDNLKNVQAAKKKKDAEAPKQDDYGFEMMKSYERIERRNTRFRIAAAINRSDNTTSIIDEQKQPTDTRETVKEESLLNDLVSQN